MNNVFKVSLLVLLSVFVLSCSNDNDSVSNEIQTFKVDKTNIQFNSKNTIVTTDNISTDFERSHILLSEGLKIRNGKIINKNNSNLWYIPFDLNSKPLLIQNKVAPCDDPVLSCDCSGGTVAQQATCGFDSTDNGDGTCSTTCDGVTCCIMTVTSGCAKSSVVVSGLLNGVLVAAEMITFNDVSYNFK